MKQHLVPIAITLAIIWVVGNSKTLGPIFVPAAPATLP
jgi:hypothetical protein